MKREQKQGKAAGAKNKPKPRAKPKRRNVVAINDERVRHRVAAEINQLVKRLGYGSLAELLRHCE